MQDKNKMKPKLTVSSVNKIMGATIFVLVFLFTFLVTSNELREHWVILLIVFGSLLGAIAIAWIVLAVVLIKKKQASDINHQVVKDALKQIKEEEKKRKYGDDQSESNN